MNANLNNPLANSFKALATLAIAHFHFSGCCSPSRRAAVDQAKKQLPLPDSGPAGHLHR